MSKIDVQTAARHRAYVAKVITTTGLDATKVARRAHLSPSTLTRFLAEEGNRAGLRRTTIEAIARATGIAPPADLLDDAPDGMPQMSLAEPHRIPIHALISFPGSDFYYWNQTAIDFAPRPPGIAHATRAFALRMPDTTMEGWRAVNELVYVDPTLAVAEGDHAFVEFQNRLAPNNPSIYRIRRVDRRNKDVVVLGTWGIKPTQAEFPRTEVLSLRRVVEWPELMSGIR